MDPVLFRLQALQADLRIPLTGPRIGIAAGEVEDLVLVVEMTLGIGHLGGQIGRGCAPSMGAM
jgi:hypothetical protein